LLEAGLRKRASGQSSVRRANGGAARRTKHKRVLEIPHITSATLARA
jgi:hypothetical protein